MTKNLQLLLMASMVALITSSCNYKDMDKTLFITAVILDKGEQEGTHNVFFEAFRPTASSNSMNAEGERIIYGVKNVSLLKGVDELNKLSNLPISFSQTKILLFTRAAAEEGLDLHINLFNHANEFTIRTYLAVWDDDPEKFEEVELKGEKFLGIYLRQHIENAERSTSHIQRITLLDLMNAAQIKGKVLAIPILKPMIQGKTQLIDIPGVALIRDFKMEGDMDTQKADLVNYMSGKIKSSFIETENPDAEGTKVILNTISCKVNTSITPNSERIQIVKDLKIKALLRGSQKTFSVDDKTLEQIKKNIIEKGKNDSLSLFKEYSSKGLDIYNLGESIYRKYPWFDQEDLLNKIDLTVNITFDIPGTNYKLDFNPPIKHNEK